MTKLSKTYQQMQTELDELVGLLRSQNVDIDISLKQYELAMLLINEMEAYLKTAKNKVTKIKKDFSA
ncbi:MAG: exodeoxyribonuclease VII small subunit [Patescibacteria group bacterium]